MAILYLPKPATPSDTANEIDKDIWNQEVGAYVKGVKLL